MRQRKDNMDKICYMPLKSKMCSDVNINRSQNVAKSEEQKEKTHILGQLSSGIAHDFNNQLMSIIDNAIMIQKIDNIDKMKEYAQRIIHISQGAENLTKKILLFSKKESKNSEIINLENILNNAVDMLDSILDKRIDVIYEYNAIGGLVIGNETQIENLILNLVINSRDAIDSTGKITIRVNDEYLSEKATLSNGEIIKRGKYIKISVEDTGTGMDEETINRMFEPYFTTKGKLNGTGLGLAIGFETVKSHLGCLNVKSKIGQGTNIEVYLPSYEAKDLQEKPKLNTEYDEMVGNVVILVDGDQNVLDVEAELFEDLGYEVAKFLNPLEVINYYKINSDKICFVVTDMIMPEMEGKELYKQLRQVNKDVKTVFVSQHSEYDDNEDFIKEDLIKDGAMFIERPFDFEELSCQIAKLYC